MSRCSVLIVDNDLKTADRAAKLLREQGYEVRVARDGSAARNMISKIPADLVLLNFRIPGGRGRDFVDYLLSRYSDFPKIIVTNCDDPKIRAELQGNEAVDFLSEPFGNDILLATISSALKSKLPASGGGEPDRLARLEKFFPFLAHEIRNPLHAISGALTVLQKKCDLQDDVVRRSLRIIKEETDHLNGFVQECLEFVHPPMKRRWAEVDINEVAGTVINVLSYMFGDAAGKIKITRDFDPGIPKIPANYEELKRAFLNILKNSFEAAGEGGNVSIRTKFAPDPAPGAVEISISDNGCGIKKEHLHNLFTPFFTTKLRGMGLGLAICRRIIAEGHGGKIFILSEEGSGTTVKIELPAGAKATRAGGREI